MRVLIVRPEPGAARTAERVRALGLEAVVLPLTRLETLAPPDVDVTAADAVAVTSANALVHAPDSLLGAIRHLPCFAVGNRTAEMARQAGFEPVADADGDADTLVGLIEAAEPRPRNILYLCGRLRRPTFEAALLADGIRVVPVETYATLPIEYSADQLSQHVEAQPIRVAMIHSAEAALALMRLVRTTSMAGGASGATMLCISSRVAAILAGAGLRTVTAAEPSEGSMLSALDGLSSAPP